MVGYKRGNKRLALCDELTRRPKACLVCNLILSLRDQKNRIGYLVLHFQHIMGTGGVGSLSTCSIDRPGVGSLSTSSIKSEPANQH